ncbi:uncharacterized protein LOC114074834 [Solanum pennellii]|uniref:Uncharacterized protein LOC114074834 n=1 Tax=Solanum pennellii TaxID=28526 RepID=A0ABM1UYV3_SOLPN|nr:uncharacterized protein LOC114074834 [Solanum pennellii]
MSFGKKGKISPWNIGPYRISDRVGNLAYKLELPPESVVINPVFHVSMLKKYMGDPSLIVPTENVGTNDHSLIVPTENVGTKGSLSYVMIRVQIFDHQVRKLRTKEVASVKMQVTRISIQRLVDPA